MLDLSGERRVLFEGSRAAQEGFGAVPGRPVPEGLTDVPLARLALIEDVVVDLADLSAFWVDGDGVKHGAQDDASWQRVTCAFDEVLVPDGAGWRVETAADRLERARLDAFLPRPEFAGACAEAGIITWDDAADWAAGNLLPAPAQAFLASLPEDDRARTRFVLLTSVRVWRLAPELVALAASLGLADAQVDALFGIVPDATG
jgi:hypothetical protein